MSDNKNYELTDDMMAAVTGGTAETGDPKFKVGDYVHYELTNPATGQTMAVNGTITSFEYVYEAGIWRYTIKMDPNPYNATEVQAIESRISYA